MAAKHKKSKPKKFNPWNNFKTHVTVYIVVFGIIGLVTLSFIMAASNHASIEPENGGLVGNISTGIDAGASGGSFVHFGSRAYSVPSSIAPDCSTDVAVALNTWLDTVPDDSTINFPTDACYLTEQAIKIDNKRGWTVKGNNTTLKRTRYNDDKDNMRHLHLSNVSNFYISDFNILGRKPTDSGYIVAVEGQMGVGIFGGSNITVDNFDIQHVHGDFVYINKYQGTSAQNVTVKNSVFTDAGRQGIAIIDVNGALIKDNNITNVDRYIIDVEPGGANTSVTNFTFDHNQTSGGGIGWLSGEGGGGNITNMVISNNTVNGPMTIKIDPPSTFRRGPISILDNTSLKEAGGDLIQLHAVDGILIRGNNTRLKLNGVGNPVNALVHLYGTTDARVINNVTLNALVTTVAEPNDTGYCESGNTPISASIPLCQ